VGSFEELVFFLQTIRQIIGWVGQNQVYRPIVYPLSDAENTVHVENYVESHFFKLIETFMMNEPTAKIANNKVLKNSIQEGQSIVTVLYRNKTNA
jgi:hypothetical protein